MVLLHNLDFYSLGIQLRREHGSDGIAAYYHHLFHLQGALSEIFDEQFHPFLAGEGEHKVVVLEDGVGPGNDGVVASGNRDYPELPELGWLQLPHELCQAEVQQGRLVVELEYRNLKLAACEIHCFRRRTALELGHYLVGCNALGIEQEFNAHLVEHQPVLGGEIFFVINPCKHFGRTEVLCEQRTHYVGFLQGGRIYGNE